MANGGGVHRGQAPGDHLGRSADRRAARASTRTARPDVDITFDAAGARRFARVTQENVGKPFAIILDDKVLSAPNINEPILGGTRADHRAASPSRAPTSSPIALRSGKLPVELKVVEERTVGPDLGADSIREGVIASDRRGRSRDRLHARHLRPLRRLCEHRAGHQRLRDPRRHGDVQRDADAAGHRRLRADDRHRGRRQRADQRAHPRGDAARAQA